MFHVWLNICLRLLQSRLSGPVAQLVEQRIENPRVGSSILPQATSFKVHTEDTIYSLCRSHRQQPIRLIPNSQQPTLEYVQIRERY